MDPRGADHARRRVRILPEDVHLGMRVLCSDKQARRIDMIERGKWKDGVAFRFSYLDGTWAEYALNQRVTVVEDA